MALILKDRVRSQSGVSGTNDITFDLNINGYQPFSVIGNGNTTYYTIAGATQWEVGIGTYTSASNTLSRDTILASSNSGAKVIFASGDKDVFVTYPAEKSVNYDALDNVGIGTTEPAAKLQIVGTSTGYATPQLRIGETGSNLSTAKQLLVGYDTTNNNGFIQANQWNTGTTSLLLQPAGGNVGIGTSNPSFKLDVVGAIRSSTALELNNGTLSGIFGLDSFTTGVVGVGSTNNIPFVLGTNSNERMRITANGGIAFNGAANYGSAGQVLQSNGDAPPTWVTAGGTGNVTSTTGTLNRLPKYSGTTTNLANSQLFDNGTTVGVGIFAGLNANAKLDVSGAINTTGGLLPRVKEAATYAALTPASAWDSSTTDIVSLTAQTGTITIGADSATTPVNGNKIIFRIVGGTGGCTVTFSTGAAKQFKGIGVTVPSSTTVAVGITMMLGAIYNTNSSRWEVVALTQG